MFVAPLCFDEGYIAFQLMFRHSVPPGSLDENSRALAAEPEACVVTVPSGSVALVKPQTLKASTLNH